jgi:hypothetical protein
MVQIRKLMVPYKEKGLLFLQGVVAGLPLPLSIIVGLPFLPLIWCEATITSGEIHNGRN